MWYVDQSDTVQTLNSNWRDQIGDPDVVAATLPNGNTKLIGMGVMVNNHLSPPQTDNWTYTFNGSLATLLTNAGASVSIGAQIQASATSQTGMSLSLAI